YRVGLNHRVRLRHGGIGLGGPGGIGGLVRSKNGHDTLQLFAGIGHCLPVAADGQKTGKVGCQRKLIFTVCPKKQRLLAELVRKQPFYEKNDNGLATSKPTFLSWLFSVPASVLP